MKSPSFGRRSESDRAARRAGRGSRRRPLVLEALEGRVVMSVTPQMVLDINPAAASSNAAAFVAVGSTAYFIADDGVHGRELWKSDGTAAGTSLVKDIKPGAASSGPSYLTDVNGRLFFTADDGANGIELWKSDGTAAGTTLVKDIYPGTWQSYYYGYSYANSGAPRFLENVNGVLFFQAQDGVHGRELWKSDGTAAGTTMVKDIVPGAGYSTPRYLTNVNGTLFFVAYTELGSALWKSDGTAAGTTPVKVISAGSLTNVNGTLYFSASDANDGAHGWELWRSDGTAAGTTMVKDIYPGQSRYYAYNGGWWYVPSSSYPNDLTNVNGTLFFTAEDGVHGRELWKSDGTAAGTSLVKDIVPRPFDAGPVELTNVGGTLFFDANDGAHGWELWRSDGTAAGTSLVKDIEPGAASSVPQELTNVNGTLFFTAGSPTLGSELWKSDGTAAGTTMVKEINPGAAGSGPSYLADVNGRLFFSADDGVHGRELWTLAEVTTRVVTPAVSGFPATITAGVAGAFTVTATNPDGTTDAGFRGIVRFSSSDPQAVLPADYTFTAADAGRRTFTATLKTAGGRSITATVLGFDGGTSTQSGITVNPAAASRFSVAGFPSPTTAGVAGTFTVTALDPYGNRATGYRGTARLGSSDAMAALPGNYTFTAADAGLHTFSATLKTAGTQVADRHRHRHRRDRRHPDGHPGQPGGGEPTGARCPDQRQGQCHLQPDRHRRGCLRQCRHRLSGHALFQQLGRNGEPAQEVHVHRRRPGHPHLLRAEA